MAVNAGLVAAVVLAAHHPKIVLGLLLLFLGVASVARRYLDPLNLRTGLLVGGFLAGLVILASPQKWWGVAVTTLDPTWLFVGATAVTDNAALTYLGSQVPLNAAMQYALVAGSVTGGGLTVIANAPNTIGARLLCGRFADDRIRPLYLLLAAVPPTAVAAACFLLL